MKKVLNYIILFIILIILFILLLSISYLLPRNKIHENIKRSVATLKIETQNYKPFYNNNYFGAYSTLDNFTDSLSLNIALDNNNKEPIIKRVLSNYYYEKDNNEIKNLSKSLDTNTKTNKEYIRYWFGAESILKILLIFNDLSEIRYINTILIISLITLLSYLLTKKTNFLYAISFILSLIFMNIIIVPMSIQYAPVMYIMLISSILLLIYYDKYEKYIGYYFFIIGMLTAYFDLLTYPMITLGYPLLIIFLLRKEKQRELSKELFYYLKLVLLWSIAYSATYIIKLVISSIVLNKDCFKIALDQLAYRMDINSTEKLSRLTVLQENFYAYFNKFTCATILLIFIVVLISIKKHGYYKLNNNYIIPMFILISPYVWYIVLSNHCHIHFWMTYRMQGVSLFALLIIIMSLININVYKNQGAKK